MTPLFARHIASATMTRLRKLPKPIAKEGQRRSPRISALEALGLESKNNATPCMSYLDNIQNNGQGPTFQTRGTKKRKLRPVQELTASPLSSPDQAVKHSRNQGVQKKSDQKLKAPSSTFVPEKRILELVLDILQRRDTYEIFAEPVDPNEVEDYYAIIEEPMDFGTMRAKLHEGMYKSLEEFEHDVFLIFNNAMHFNSSGTIYFRQARGINELARKVFDVLKVNPEKFELEFSETKRKIGRRNQGGFRDSTDIKSSEITIDVSSKSMPCSSRGTSNRQSFKANHGYSDIAKLVEGRDLRVPTGTKDSSRYRSYQDDKRCTYRPLSLGEDESIFSTVYGKLKQLERVHQQDLGYKDSLMLFIKDLGPTAQNIAKRKLLGCEIRAASTSAPWTTKAFNTDTSPISPYPLNQFPDHRNGMRSARGKMDLEIPCGGETAYISDETDNAKVEGTLNACRCSEKACSPIESHNQGSNRCSFQCDRVFPNQRFCSDLYCSGACAEYLDCSGHGSREVGKKPTMMLLDKSKSVNQEQLSASVLGNSQTNVLEPRMGNKCKFQSLPCPLKSSNVSCFVQDKSQIQKSSSESAMGDGQSIEADCLAREFSCNSEAMKISKAEQTVPLASSFVYSLPYLKTRLNHIHSSEQYTLLQ